ncbi:hypothetical protein KUL42_13720 [Alteromonas sp. KUL42]|nr:hypothetical protein KUL42_13720 [Alteromonas sp. KUL42]
MATVVNPKIIMLAGLNVYSTGLRQITTTIAANINEEINSELR